ncbi:MAG: polyphosphate kinase 2 family protein, partial [Chthoniobacterales bacterium]
MPVASAARPVRLVDLDQSKSHTPEKYREKLRAGHLRLLGLQHALKNSKRSVIIVVEGPDAAGKGGMIKRLVERLDPRHIRVYSTIKPTAEEYAHHYLWRFWNKLPRRGEIAIFDRSWYGRGRGARIEG